MIQSLILEQQLTIQNNGICLKRTSEVITRQANWIFIFKSIRLGYFVPIVLDWTTVVSLELVMFSLVVLFAPGDIYRCMGEQSVVQYRDEPCENGEGAVFRNGSGDRSGQNLSRWLQELNAEAHPASNGKRVVRPRPTWVLLAISLAPLPEGSRALAECSLQVFECTDGDSVQMDRCVARIETCSARRRTQCCHSAYISRYQRLYTAGIGRHDAVRVALLGAD